MRGNCFFQPGQIFLVLLDELAQAAKLTDQATRSDVALVSINLQRKEYDKALRAVEALEKKLPNSSVTHNLRAVALLGKKDNVGARKSFEKALALDPSFYPAVENLARLDLDEKKPGEARKRFEALLAKDAKNLQAMLAMADLAMLGKQDKEYLAWLEKAVSTHPKELQPRVLLSRYFLAKNDIKQALAIAKDAIKSNPEDLQTLRFLGSTQLAGKDSKAAMETYQQLVQKSPNAADAHLRLGLAQAAANNNDEARSSFNNALKIKPDFVAAMDAHVQLEMLQKNYDSAMSWSKKIQAIQPRFPDGHDREGDIYMMQQRYDFAAQAYQTALAKGAGTRGLLKLQDAMFKSGDAKGAQMKLESWIKQHPNDFAARSALANHMLRSGQDKSAIAQFEAILRQRPNEIMVQNNLAGLYQKLKDPRALVLAETAYKAQPDHPAIQDSLGWILLEQGQTKRSLELLAQAAGKAANNTTIQYHYAVALGRDGNTAKAKEILQKLLAGGEKFTEREAAAQFLNGLK